LLICWRWRRIARLSGWCGWCRWFGCRFINYVIIVPLLLWGFLAISICSRCNSHCTSNYSTDHSHERMNIDSKLLLYNILHLTKHLLFYSSGFFAAARGTARCARTRATSIYLSRRSRTTWRIRAISRRSVLLEQVLLEKRSDSSLTICTFFTFFIRFTIFLSIFCVFAFLWSESLLFLWLLFLLLLFF